MESEKKNEIFKYIKFAIMIFIRPQYTMTRVVKNPNWIFPLLLIILFNATYSLLIYDIKTIDRINELKNIEIHTPISELRNNTIPKYFLLVANSINIFMGLFLFSFIIHFICNTILQGKARFKSIFAMMTWTSLVSVIELIIKYIIILNKGSTKGVTLSLALISPGLIKSDNLSWLYIILSSLSLQVIWQGTLLIFGLSILYRFSKKRALFIIVLLWIIWAIFIYVISFLS